MMIWLMVINCKSLKVSSQSLQWKLRFIEIKVGI